MIKIAHIITRLTLGGAQETVMFCYNNYSKDKFDLYFLAGGESDFQSSEILSPFINNKNVIIIKQMFNKINPLKDLSALINIFKFLKKNKIQIVQTHSSKAGILGRIAAKLAGIPVVIHMVHGWSFHDRMSKANKYLYICLERFAAWFTDKFITVTTLDIEKGLKEGIGAKRKYITIRSGIDFEKFENPDLEKVQELKNRFNGKKIIGTVGRLSEQKNPIDFLKIAKILTEKRDDLHFLIIGDGEKRKEVEEFMENNDLIEHVTLLGLRTDVNDLIHAFDIFLLTSLWEGLPRVIPEAMCCKVPVVANCVDGVGEIIENGINGFLTAPYDVEDAALKIEKLIDDAELREKVIKKASETIYPEYSAHYMVEKMENLYKDVMKEKMIINDFIKTLN